MELGKNIRYHRKFNKIRSVDLAQQVGVGQPYISEIEKGRKVPSIEVLQRIATALDLTTSELLGEVRPQLDGNMLRLVKAAQGLNDRQVTAVIEMIDAFTYEEEYADTNSRVAEE